MRVAVVVAAALLASPVQAGPCDELCREKRASWERDYSEFQADNRARDSDRRLRAIQDEVSTLRREAEDRRVSEEYWQRPRRR